MLLAETLEPSFTGSVFLGPRNIPEQSLLFDREEGGIALGDNSEGLLGFMWAAYVRDASDIYVKREGQPASLLYSGSEISEVSLTFQENMQPILAVVEEGDAKLLIFDGGGTLEETTPLPGAVNPRVTYEDKRPLSVAGGSVGAIVVYLRDGDLRSRSSLTDYAEETVLEVDTDATAVLKVGMDEENRMQIKLACEGPVFPGRARVTADRVTRATADGRFRSTKSKGPGGFFPE